MLLLLSLIIATGYSTRSKITIVPGKDGRPVFIVHSPTANPTHSPTSSPTIAPTHSPTVKPTKAPTTKSPTLSPTIAPTLSPTERWDSMPIQSNSKGSNSKTKRKNHKKIDTSSKQLVNEDKYLEEQLKLAKQAKQEALRQSEKQKQKQKPNTKQLSNTIDLYTFLAGADMRIPPKIMNNFINQELNDCNLVLIQAWKDEIKLQNHHLRYVTDLDEALLISWELLMLLGYPELNESQINSLFTTSIVKLAYLDESVYLSIFRNFPKEEDARSVFSFDLILRFHTAAREMIAKNIPFEDGFADDLHIPLNADYISFLATYLKVSMKYLIAAKFNEIQDMFTNTSYGIDGKIPKKIRRQQFNEILSHHKNIHTEIVKYCDYISYLHHGNNLSEQYQEETLKVAEKINFVKTELINFAPALQMACNIYEWRRVNPKQNQIRIAVLCGTWIRYSLIDELLTNLGYNAQSVRRFIVLSKSDTQFNVTQFNISDVKKLDEKYERLYLTSNKFKVSNLTQVKSNKYVQQVLDQKTGMIIEIINGAENWSEEELVQYHNSNGHDSFLYLSENLSGSQRLLNFLSMTLGIFIDFAERNGSHVELATIGLTSAFIRETSDQSWFDIDFLLKDLEPHLKTNGFCRMIKEQYEAIKKNDTCVNWPIIKQAFDSTLIQDFLSFDDTVMDYVLAVTVKEMIIQDELLDYFNERATAFKEMLDICWLVLHDRCVDKLINTVTLQRLSDTKDLLIHHFGEFQSLYQFSIIGNHIHEWREQNMTKGLIIVADETMTNLPVLFELLNIVDIY